MTVSSVSVPPCASRYLISQLRSVSAPTPAYTGSTSAGGFRIGQGVQHAKFGEGVIVACEGYGSEARVQVNFGAHGMKWLALQYAKLVKCGE